MKVTLSVIKADIGSIGGHIRPSDRLMDTVRNYVREGGQGFLRDVYVNSTGDDVHILMTHERGKEDSKVHELAWNAFKAGTEVAKEQGLYGAGQDLLKDAFSGNVRGLGPAVAELEFEERPNEPFLLFTADKTEPGAFSLPLYLSFCDPMFCPGLLLSPKIGRGFTFTIMDVEYTEGDRVVTLDSPEDLYDIATLLRDNARFVVESIHTKDGEPVVAVSTTRLHNVAGKYVGKDDPVMLYRTQSSFPATGEALHPWAIAHYVGGCSRGSHNAPIMPVKLATPISYFDGPPIVSCAAFCVHEGEFTEVADGFDHPFWDYVREKAARKLVEMREQGFSGAAMLPYSELEYGGIVERMDALDERFVVREKAPEPEKVPAS